MDTEEIKIRKKSLVNPKNAILTLFTLLILFAGLATYFYIKATTDPVKAAQKELANTIKLVSRHMVLPTDETPTMATVSDPAKLRDQAFFTHAQKGDKVLIYSSSAKAILYSPTLDRVVEVAPISTSVNTGK